METRNYLTIVRENLVDFFIPSHIPGTWAYSAHEKGNRRKRKCVGHGFASTHPMDRNNKDLLL